MVERLSKLAVKLAQEFIRIPSISGNEGKLASYVKDVLSELGVDSVFIDDLGNVIATIKGSTDKEPLIFEGHLDHVDPGNIELWNVDPYSGKIINGKLYGRGAVDMKSALAAMVASVTILSKKELERTIHYVFVTHEETAEGVAFKHAMEFSIKSKPYVVILGEATNLNIHVGHRGRCLIEYVILGKTAHASMPHLGKNSIVGVVKALSYVLTNFERSKPYHNMLGYGTLAPTILECYPKISPQIPDKCRVVFDRRILPNETEDNILGFFEYSKEFLEREGFSVKASLLVKELRFWTGKTLIVKNFFKPWFIDPSNENVRKALYTIRSSINSKAKVNVWKFSTDGVYSAGEKGYLTMGFGPGDEELAHQPNENVSVKHVEKAALGYVSLALTFQ